jgi:hypothetical protein
MSIDAVESRISQILQMQQQLLDPAASASVTAASATGTSPASSQSFSSALASAVGAQFPQTPGVPSTPVSSSGVTPPASAISGSGYVNPVPGWSASRVDQGSDGTLTSKGFLAPGRSQILIADSSNAGWGGGGYIAARLLDGPNAGDVYYVAEGVAPSAGLTAGQVVSAGTQIATPAVSPYNGILGNIESGWANPSSPGTPLAQALPGYSGDESTAAVTAGSSWNNFISSLGAEASHLDAGAASPQASLLNAFPTL